jgi:predicted small secreted protein
MYAVLFKGDFMKFITIALSLIALLALTACNTVQGVGQDIKKAGGAIEDAATKKK